MPSNFLQSMLIFAKLKHFANKKSPLKKDNFKNIFYSIAITATHLLRQIFFASSALRTCAIVIYFADL